MNNDLQIAYQNGINALIRMEQKRNGSDKNSMAIGACYALMNAIFPDKRMNVGLDVQRILANLESDMLASKEGGKLSPLESVRKKVAEEKA